MQVVFFGTAYFAVPILDALCHAGHQVDPVITAPRKPKGRGLKPLPSPVEATAGQRGLRVLTPVNPHDNDVIRIITQVKPDVGILAAYGTILRDVLISLPQLGFLNVHPSLLPEYRGAAPIQRALLDGRTVTGVSVIIMTNELDAGDIICQRSVQIQPDENAGDLSLRLAKIGAELTLTALDSLRTGCVRTIPQPPVGISWAPRLSKADRILDWTLPAIKIHNQIRALAPEPGAITTFRGSPVLVLRSRVLPLETELPAGTLILEHPGTVVATGYGTLELLQVAPAGSRVQTGVDFRNGRRFQPGEKLL
ncbi:MAG: methionyl-tRNA formyltransferase [candidate division WOR-3 bacterium]